MFKASTSLGGSLTVFLLLGVLFSHVAAQPERREPQRAPPRARRQRIPRAPPTLNQPPSAPEPNVPGLAAPSAANPPPPSPSPGPLSCTSFFRSLDGTCTSAVNANLGKIERPQFSYGQTVDASRPTGTDRPSARLISNVVSAQAGNILSRRRLNEMVTFMGQFLDHNFIATPVTKGDHFDISIPRDDPIFANFSGGRLTLERSVRQADAAGRSRPINALSSAVDLTAVYGPSDARLRALRTMQNGQMKTSPGDLLPLNTGRLPNAPSRSADFFVAGDLRANENPVLTALHTLFVREHNFIAWELQQRFPFWTDELIFQNAKLVNTAQYQKIIFEEFYPQMTGRRLPRYRGYRPYVDPTISDVFGAMAFRIGHTMVGNQINRRGRRNRRMPPIPFKDMFFRRKGIFNQGIEPFLRGAIFERSQEVDRFVVNVLRNFLFTNVQNEIGFDLMALNIQRGRDHALPSYNQLRKLFGRRPAVRFAQITRNRAAQNALSTAYGGDINKVDGIVGLFAEDHVPFASMGRTMLIMWRREFQRLRDGDRLYFRRRAAYPRILLKRYRRVRKLFRRRNVFKKLILENTNIKRREIRGSVWRARW